MADSNKEQLAYLRESTWGTTPTSAMTIVPWVSGSMAAGIETIRSNSLRSDAQLADSIQVGESPTGSFDFEFTADTYDDFLRSVLRSDADWSTAVNFSGTATTDANGITGTGVGTNAAKGQWVYVDGFANAGNNGWKKVTTSTTNDITLSPVPSDVEADKSGVTIKGSYIQNGSTLHSYTFSQRFTDLTNKYHSLTGARLNSATLSATPNGIITLNVGFDGKDISQGTAWAGGSASDAATKDVASEVTAYDAVFISADSGAAAAYAAVSEDVLESTIGISVANRPQKGLGSVTNTGMQQNSVDATGSIQFYVNNNTWTYEGYLYGFTKFGLAQALNMGSDERYLIEFPKIAFTGEPGNNAGINTDLVYAFDFAAEPGGSYGSSSTEQTILISKTG
jgi:hypothetical protein